LNNKYKLKFFESLYLENTLLPILITFFLKKKIFNIVFKKKSKEKEKETYKNIYLFIYLFLSMEIILTYIIVNHEYYSMTLK